MERARAALALAALVAVSSAGSPSVLAGSPAWRVAGAGALLATNVAAAPDQRRLDDTSCEAVCEVSTFLALELRQKPCRYHAGVVILSMIR